MRLDLRHHQGMGLCLVHPISPLMFLNIGPHLLDIGRDALSLGNHLRSVLIRVKESDISLHTLIEIRDIEITTRRNK